VSGTRVVLTVAAVLAAALVGYPLVVLATAGAPDFPGGRGECARVATGDGQGELELVAAHLSYLPDAERLRDELVGLGFTNMQVKTDGCGWWKVTNDGIDSFAQGESAAEEVRRAGYDARLELDPSVP
jgi:hypothetical protein